jgi:hypothetical protein
MADGLTFGLRRPRSPHGKSPNCPRRRSERRSDHRASRREVLFTEVRGIVILRTTPFGVSRKFAGLGEALLFVFCFIL